jgi:sulfur-carrier protein
VTRIQVELPANLTRLAHCPAMVDLDVPDPPTLRGMMDALEAKLPALGGTVRDHVTQQRRAYLRFFACSEDISFQDLDAPLPQAVADGREAVLIIGAVSGG